MSGAQPGTGRGSRWCAATPRRPAAAASSSSATSASASARRAGAATTASAGTSSHGDGPFPLATRVAHERWGEGVVQRYEDDKLVVLFDGEGYKTLALAIVLEGDLLRRA